MSYHAGTRGLKRLGIPDGDPRITCDICGISRSVQKPSGQPYAWLLNGKAAPGWSGGRQNGNTRYDLCPECKDKVDEAEWP